MSHSRNVDNEVNAPSQMRDVILWGCAAVVAATTAISSYVAQSDFKFPKIASLIVDQNIVEPEIASINKPEFDNITTGSIPPKNTDKTSSNSANNGQAESFGTTIVSRQQNADAVRRMQSQGDAQNSDNTPVISATDTKIGQGPIGIDLGSGHSFSVLGKRYSALVNAAPTLFNNLSPVLQSLNMKPVSKLILLWGLLKTYKQHRFCVKSFNFVSTHPANRQITPAGS